jgi:hypothetical protein
MNKDVEKVIKEEKKSIIEITKKASLFGVIETKDDLVNATELSVKIKKKIDELEEERLEYTAPLNVVLKKINSGFKELTVPLGDAFKEIKKLMLDYRERKEQERAEAERQMQNSTNSSELIVETVIPDSIESRSGESRTTRRWVFVIVNEKEVPREYLTTNDKKIDEAIKSGIREIRGLKIYQEKGISVYPNKE